MTPPDFNPITPMTKEEREARKVVPIPRTSVDAATLLRLDFPPLNFVVPDLISEGLTVLAGKPKIGKSWLALGLANAIATGGLALGNIPSERGDVLYLALEDNERRLQTRLKAVLQGGDGPDPGRLTLATQWARLDDGGLDRIQSWADIADNPKAVFIDVWAKVKPQKDVKGGTIYDSDYAAAQDIQSAANERNLAVVALHHTKKGAESDAVDEVSGSTGLTGAADTVAVLRKERGQADATLFATGREIPEVDWALQHDPETGLWLKLGEAAEYRHSKQRMAILRSLDDGPKSPTEVARELDANVSTIKTTLMRMVKSGDLHNSGGKYGHVVR